MQWCGGALSFDGAHESGMEDEEVHCVLYEEERKRWRTFVQREERKRLVYAHQEFESRFAVAMEVRPKTTVAELAIPLQCESELWDANTAREWAALLNSKLSSRLPQRNGSLNLSATSLLQEFSRRSSDIGDGRGFRTRDAS
jgi:hypothetical protein